MWSKCMCVITTMSTDGGSAPAAPSSLSSAPPPGLRNSATSGTSGKAARNRLGKSATMSQMAKTSASPIFTLPRSTGLDPERTGDDQALDLARALHDAQHPHHPEDPLHRAFAQQAHPPEDLHGAVGHAVHHLGVVEFHDARLLDRGLPL